MERIVTVVLILLAVFVGWLISEMSWRSWLKRMTRRDGEHK